MHQPFELQRIGTSRSQFLNGHTSNAAKLRWLLLFTFMNPVDATYRLWNLVYLEENYYFFSNLNDDGKYALWIQIIDQIRASLLDSTCGYTDVSIRESDSGLVQTWNDSTCFGDFAVGHAADSQSVIPGYEDCLVQDIINATLARFHCPTPPSDDSGHSAGFYIAIIIGSLLCLISLCYIVGSVGQAFQRKSYDKVPETTEVTRM